MGHKYLGQKSPFFFSKGPPECLSWPFQYCWGISFLSTRECSANASLRALCSALHGTKDIHLLILHAGIYMEKMGGSIHRAFPEKLFTQCPLELGCQLGAPRRQGPCQFLFTLGTLLAQGLTLRISVNVG